MSDSLRKIPREQFETFEAMILSDQITASELELLFSTNVDFSGWYRARAVARKSLTGSAERAGAPCREWGFEVE